MPSAPSSATIGLGGGIRRPPTVSWRARLANSPWTYRLAVLVIFGIIWQAFAIWAHSLLIPTFTGTVVSVFQLAADPRVIGAFGLSNEALVLGFVISVVVGIPLGLGIARFRALESFVDPYLAILMVTPMAALIPLFIMSLGLGLSPRVLIVVVFSIPVIIVNSRTGVRQVDPGLIEMATSYGANERTIWRRILLPSALPAIMTGVRLGLGRAVTGMVIIELLMVAVGIGDLILEFRGNFEADSLYAVVVLVILEALVLISIVRWVERKLAPWAHDMVLRE